MAKKSKPKKETKKPQSKSRGKVILLKIWKFVWMSVVGFFVGSVLLVFVYRWVPVPVTPLMLIRYTENSFSGKPARLEKDWKPLDEISENLQLAVVCHEDQNFLEHYGFDFGAIEKAMKENKKRKIPRGASTISQQTAKNVFLWPGRNYLRKGLEVYFTFLIETFWSKERIMEVYLNVIEMGDGIYGAEAASQEYFNVHASELTASQAALIAAILPNPIKYSAKTPGPYVQKRQAWVLKQMRFWGMDLDYDKVEKEDMKKQKKTK
jgi:monofunctional biosynthetic peptidoglycan transglycosylase